MNSRTNILIAQNESRWSLAGDNLYVDLDLTDDNLPCGQRLAIESSILEITEVPHRGCKKFAERFGTDALEFVNWDAENKLRLRGVYGRIVQAGVIGVSDVVKEV